MNNPKKRLLTGLKPTGNLHIGNYFGALKPFVDFLAENAAYESFLMVADYHALTTAKDAAQLRQDTYNIVRDYLAAGVDPEKVTLFKQSDNPDHTELAWILNCQVTVPFLMQAHAYKDKVAKGQEANAGLFTYPMLMAADILLYDTDLVPVGEDQRQHVEYAREAAGKFNRQYGEILKNPQEKIMPAVGIIPGIDGQKMSKSYNNTIPLFAEPAVVEKAVMSIVTDSTGDWPENVYNIHRLIKSEDELQPLYQNSAGRYGDLKKALAADLNDYFAEMRTRRQNISDDEVRTVLENGVQRSRAVTKEVLARVKQAIGITL